MARPRIKVLVVDDSPVVRQVIKKMLSNSPAVDRVETAVNGSIALRKIKKIDPDVVTMDVEMPGMDGLETLRQIMAQSPRPVIMISAHTYEGAEKTIQALEIGAVDFIQKPGGQLAKELSAIEKELIAKVVAVGSTRARRARLWKKLKYAETPAVEEPPPRIRPIPPGAVRVVAIGASTGGTEAIRTILTRLPADFPAGIAVVQHMPPGFTTAFAKRLNELSSIQVKEAAHRDLILPGRALIAPGHSHLKVRRGEQGDFVELNRRPEVNGHRPSVDVMFDSVAEQFGKLSIGVLLTGMGQDGAEGMSRIRETGGYTLAQDEKSCVVFGMPRAAIRMGAAVEVADLLGIPALLQRLVAAGARSAEDKPRAASART